MSGKKGKKVKTKAISLNEFLGDTPAPTSIQKIKSWAEEEEDEFVYSARPKAPVILPTAPRAASDQCFNEENVPTHPPFVAYISNLPYDVDEEDLYDFFQEMKVSSMRLPKDANKFKGYGYVEFEDRQSLIDALSMIDTNLKSRRVRIEVSNSSNDDRRGGRMGRMGDNRREYSPERTTGDWRTARLEDGPRQEDDREDRGYRSRGFDRRDDMRGDRDSGFEDAKPGNWRDVPREALPDRPRPSFRDSRPGGGSDDRDRMGSRFSDRGMRGRDGSRERDGGERGGGFGPRRYYNDDMDKDRDRDRWSSLRSQPREPVDNSSGPPSSESAAPMTRPKLELKPRTKPIEPEAAPPKTEAEGDSAEPGAPAPAPVPSANIFGAAKPVDTAAREREIEERLAKTAEERSKEAGPREGAWGRRNGQESRFDQERSRPTWRSRPDNRNENDQDSKSDKNPANSRDSSKPRSQRSDSRGSSSSRNATVRGPSKHNDDHSNKDEPEKEKKKVELTEEEELSRMPKAKDDQSPNFVASNKYSMLPDDVDLDNVTE